MFEELHKDGSACPICNKELKKSIYISKNDFLAICKNNCFAYDMNEMDLRVRIFTDIYANTEKALKENKNFKKYSAFAVREKIAYWKENNRYLAEILERM